MTAGTTRMRVTFELDIPSSTNRRDFDQSILDMLNNQFQDPPGYLTLVYAATEIAEEHTLRRRPLK